MPRKWPHSAGAKKLSVPLSSKKAPVGVISDQVQRKTQSSSVALLLSPEIKAVCRPEKKEKKCKQSRSCRAWK